MVPRNIIVNRVQFTCIDRINSRIFFFFYSKLRSNNARTPKRNTRRCLLDFDRIHTCMFLLRFETAIRVFYHAIAIIISRPFLSLPRATHNCTWVWRKSSWFFLPRGRGGVSQALRKSP